MPTTLMVSLLFFSVATVVLASGIFVLQNNYKAPANRAFFVLTAAIVIWSSGMALSAAATDAATCEIFRRVSAIGWGTVYAILLHFILIITDKFTSIKKRWFYVFLYLPALFSLFAFAVPNGLNPFPYDMRQTEYGWINVAHNNVWDWVFYVYYIGFTLMGLFLLYQWGKKSSDDITKKKSRIMSLSIISALVLGTITDVILSSLFSELPQMAPLIMLIPVFSIYHVLQQESFSITEVIDKKNNYIILFISVFIYIVLSALQVFVSNSSFIIGPVAFDESVIRGIIVQIQMFISIYLVLRENRPGYILSVIMNSINLLSMVILLVKNASADTLPGIISYAGVLVIITLIKAYKEKNATNIKKINSLNKKLVFDEALYHNVFNQAPVGIAIMQDKAHANRPEFSDTAMNPIYEKILGRREDELRHLTWVEITHPEDLEADLEKFAQFKKGEVKSYAMEKRFIKPDGSAVWTFIRVSPLSGMFDDHSMHLCLIEDISERKEAEFALKESERRESVLLSHLPGLAYRCNYDYEWTMQYVSDGCFNLTEYTPDSLLYNRDLSYNDLISPEYREALWNEWDRILAKRQPFKYEYEIITATGKRKWVLEMGQGIHNNEGEVEALEGIILDISGRKEVENQLRYINEHDMWTNLYNRDYLEFLLNKDIKKRDGLKRALISINLSTVQLLTANYGFHYTLNMIKKAAETLSQYCTDKRLLFQTYDNRFVFYLIDYKDKNELVGFSDAISETLESLFQTDRIGGGIGVLEIEKADNDVDIDLLLRRLIIASERAINIVEKNFSVCFYNEELEALVNREGNIRKALSTIAADDTGGELFLQYQPVVDLKTNSVVGFEALSRLQTEKLGLVSPVEFIPIAEKTELIIPIGEKVIIKAFHFSNKLKGHGYDGIGVSINISAIQLMKSDFTSRLFELMSEMQVDPRNIGIEITESIFEDNYDDINNIIQKLRDAGIHIAIDDFGTGYSSLAREKELKVDCLKIDKYFIDKLLYADLNKAITSDIISMAHKLGHCAIAEGVEHESQLQYLKEHDCDRIQGYLISKPLDEKDALAFLKNQE
ncbi:MAG: EAL domain-containing protein [Thiohalomonadaceae bacterium]